MDTRRIEAGVRDLIGSADGRRVRNAGMSGLRAQLGMEVHDRYRQLREAELGETFRPERAIKLPLDVDGFSATISGRIDGVIEDEQGLLLEEVKSVLAAPTSWGAAELDAARLQVATYALALLRTGETRTLTLRLVLVGVTDGEQRYVPVPFDPDATQRRLESLLRAAVAAEQTVRRRAEARARWAAAMTFPHDEMREGQSMLVEAIDDAFAESRPLLVQAPTGTGKTAAALFGTLRHAAADGHRVFYATPKTTQHGHVGETFEALCQASPASASDASAPPPPFAVSLHARGRVCWTGSGPCNRLKCTKLRDHASRAPAVVAQAPHEYRYVGLEQLKALAERNALCPYELGFDLAEQADLVVGDFNYVFDPSIALLSGSKRKTVVVIDEAHNLFSRACAYSSARLVLTDIEKAEQSIDPADPLAMTMSTWLAELRGIVRQTAQAANAPEEPGTMIVHEGTLELSSLPYQLDAHASSARPLLLRWMAGNSERPARDSDDADPVADVLRTVIRMSDAMAMPSASLVPYAIGPRARLGPGVGVVCVDPAPQLTRRHKDALGTVVMSATLAPLDYWSDVLGLDALDPVSMSVPSPFSPDQRKVVIVPTVSTTYRDRQQSLPEVARLIAETVAARPGPYLAFFPSFAYLSAVRPHLADVGQLLSQTPRSRLSERRALLDRFTQGKGPRLLLAVTGGVFGEGIDLPGNALLGAIVVGPCLPPLGFGRAAMARHYEATRQAGFAYAMVYPGLQRVVQAAGRVIRHEDDQGVVVLIGRRFVRPEIIECLPDDWYRYDPEELVPEHPMQALNEFWGDG